jgi:uncharacterized protein (TIGR02996 family)
MGDLEQHEAFLRAIFDAPEDDTARLVYADYLQEHGQEKRAQLIRVQIELAGLPRWGASFADPERRFDLLTQQELLLQDTLPAASYWNRGFPHPTLGAQVNGADLADPLALRWKVVTECPHWFGATHLVLRARPPLDAARVEALFAQPALARVTALNLRGEQELDEYDADFVEGEQNEGLLAVYRIHPTLAPSGLLALVSHKAMRRVTELDLTDNDLDNDAARAIVRSPYLDNLKRLNLLAGNRFRGRVWQQVIERFGEDVVGGGEEGDGDIPF